MSVSPSAVLLAVLFLGMSPCTPAEVYEDFEGRALSVRWTAVGNLQASRESEVVDGRGNRFVRLRGAAAKTILATQATAPKPDYLETGALKFRVRAAGATPDKPTAIEVHVYSAKRGGARFWHKVVVASDEWREWEIPLAFFRHSGGHFLRWDEVERFGFFLREKATVDLDDIAWVEGSPLLTAPVLKPIAFPRGDGRIAVSDRFVVLTNAEQDDVHLLEELGRLQRMVEADFPAVKQIGFKVPLVIHATREQYREFWPRLAARFSSKIELPEGDGFAAMGVASTFHDPAQVVRPVILHEAAHALLAPVLGFSNKSEWVHEGLATRYQLSWTGQDLHRLVRNDVAAGRLPKLADFASGRALELREYRHAALFVEYLMADPVRKKAFLRALAFMGHKGSTDFSLVAKGAFGSSVEQMQREWEGWAELGIGN